MRVFLTGGTGFLGQYLLAELLERGHDVCCLYRTDQRRIDTVRFLSGFGLPRTSSSLFWVKGDVLDAAKRWREWCGEQRRLEDLDSILHCAASTRFHLDKHGEPIRTNVGSAEALKALIAIQPMQVHLISTAYVCGLIQDQTVTEVNHHAGNFGNIYEESKWEAEQIWTGHATILRPSIIVGHSETARCTAFTGWYILFHALYLLARLAGDRARVGPLDLHLDLPVNAHSSANMVSVDYVAKATIQLIENALNHNRIFHLTHPDPPTYEFTRRYIEKRFGLTGVNFIGVGGGFPKPRNLVEKMALRQMQSILRHFQSNPLFDRSNTDAAGLDVIPSPITEESLDKLIDYAIAHDWGNQ